MIFKAFCDKIKKKIANGQFQENPNCLSSPLWTCNKLVGKENGNERGNYRASQHCWDRAHRLSGDGGVCSCRDCATRLRQMAPEIG